MKVIYRQYKIRLMGLVSSYTTQRIITDGGNQISRRLEQLSSGYKNAKFCRKLAIHYICRQFYAFESFRIWDR